MSHIMHFKKYVHIGLMVFVVLAASMCVFPPLVSAATDPFSEACKNISSDPDVKKPEACMHNGSNPVSGPDGVLMNITNAIALIAGIVAVIIIIIAGFQFVFSRGDSQKAANARNAIVYAIVGIIVIVVSRSIVAYVITKV